MIYIVGIFLFGIYVIYAGFNMKKSDVIINRVKGIGSIVTGVVITALAFFEILIRLIK